MTPAIPEEIQSATDTLSNLTYRLMESFYQENQIYLAQQRIAKLRASIDRERQRITQLRAAIQRHKEQDRHRRQSAKIKDQTERKAAMA
jgi:hypothetical protein